MRFLINKPRAITMSMVIHIIKQDAENFKRTRNRKYR